MVFLMSQFAKNHRRSWLVKNGFSRIEKFINFGKYNYTNKKGYHIDFDIRKINLDDPGL